MNFDRAAWRFFSVHRSEFRFVIPLFFLYFLSNAGYAVGQIYCETLFINAYGAAGFSGFFVQSGIALIAAGIVYNSFLLRKSLFSGYFYLIALIMALIAAGFLLDNAQYRWLPFYLYLGNFLATFFLDIHFFNYAYQYLTIRNSKRIVPFLIGGGKMGGIAAGMAIYLLFTDRIETAGPLLWGMNTALLLVPLLALRHSGIARYHAPGERGGSARSSLAKKIRSSLSSPIFTVTVAAVFVMAVLNQVSEYYVADIINRRFPGRAELASFLSIYSFVADFITLIVATTMTARVIRRIGVPASNTVYPGSFTAFFLLIALAPGLGTAIMMRFVKKSLSQIIRAPVYNIIMASSPRDRMAEVKSFISGIANPMGMMAGGGAIYILHHHLPPAAGIAVTVTLASLYLLASLAQNRAYIASLKRALSFTGRDEPLLDINDMIELAAREKDSPESQKIVEELFREAPSAQGLELLAPRFESLSPASREHMLHYLSTVNHPLRRDVIARSLSDRSPLVRSLAYRFIKGLSPIERGRLLSGARARKKLSVEQFCIRHLAGEALAVKEGREKDAINSLFARTTSRVLAREIPLAEFIMLLHVFPFELIRGYAVEVAVKTGHPIMLRNMLPHLDELDSVETAHLMNTFIRSDRDMVVSVYTWGKNITAKEIIFLLDSRFDLDDRRMESMFRHNRNEEVIARIAASIDDRISHERKANYLGYLMAVRAKPMALLRSFIEQEIQETIRGEDLWARLAAESECLPADSALLARFLQAAMEDALNIHRSLMIKAVAIMTGTHIDDVYEANLLLHDDEVRESLLEYMETSGEEARRVARHLGRAEGGQTPADPVLPGAEKKVTEESIAHLAWFMPRCALETGLSALVQAQIPAPRGSKSLSRKEKKTMLNHLQKIMILKESPLFAGMPMTELIRLAGITAEREIGPSLTLIREGDMGDELFIITEGKVEVLAGRKFISTMGPGECIGELSVIDTEPRSSSVRTLTRCRMLSIKRKDFIAAVNEEPSMAVNIMKILAQRLRFHLSKACSEPGE